MSEELTPQDMLDIANEVESEEIWALENGEVFSYIRATSECPYKRTEYVPQTNDSQKLGVRDYLDDLGVHAQKTFDGKRWEFFSNSPCRVYPSHENKKVAALLAVKALIGEGV